MASAEERAEAERIRTETEAWQAAPDRDEDLATLPVLRREDVDALKQNGTLVFLDRPLEALLPTDDRPLADNVQKLRALYEARYPVYTAAADVPVPVTGTPEETAETILEKLR